MTQKEFLQEVGLLTLKTFIPSVIILLALGFLLKIDLFFNPLAHFVAFMANVLSALSIMKTKVKEDK